MWYALKTDTYRTMEHEISAAGQVEIPLNMSS